MEHVLSTCQARFQSLAPEPVKMSKMEKEKKGGKLPAYQKDTVTQSYV